MAQYIIRPTKSPKLVTSSPSIAKLPRLSTRQRIITRASSPKQSNAPQNAQTAVELGLTSFNRGDHTTALNLFLTAKSLARNDDESAAALYNSACALIKLQRWAEAADAVVEAINNHGLRLSVALKDDDLAPLRERREWIEALSKVAGGITDENYVKLRSEAKAPFRLVRIFVLGGLAAAAALGLIVTLTRLGGAFAGGEGAPDLNETLTNLAVNAGGLAVLSWLVSRDITAQGRDREIIAREEELAKLQIDTTSSGKKRGSKVLPLASLRGGYRPIILAGNKTQVTKALSAADQYYEELAMRGVCLVPVVLPSSSDGSAGDDPDAKLAKLKQEFSRANSPTNSSGEGKGFQSSASSITSASSSSSSSSPSSSSPPSEAAPTFITSSSNNNNNKSSKWVLKVHDEQEWGQWLTKQQQLLKNKTISSANVGNLLYIQIQLDGSVRASGVGMPPWSKFIDDIPEMDDIRTKFTDGAGIR